MRQESYSYGQGAVFLAKRHADGATAPFRWVGDVSELSISFSIEDFTHKESYSGQRQEVRKIITGKTGELSVKFHEFSSENLSLVLLGKSQQVEAGTSTFKLPATIKAGDRFALPHQHVHSVTIASLSANTDFIVDETFGTIEFIKPQSEAKTVNYSYKAVESVAIFNDNPQDLVLRFEGINLAEQEQYRLVELYKVNFNPTEALNLINNESNLDGLDAKAKILADTTKPTTGDLGRFGRVIHIHKTA